jgi:hypothetical protein
MSEDDFAKEVDFIVERVGRFQGMLEGEAADGREKRVNALWTCHVTADT